MEHLFTSLLISSHFFLILLCTEIPNSCLNHADTDNLTIQPMQGEGFPAINTRCSNEYIIIDVNKDENWLQYFSSYRKYHYAVYGPERDDIVNWNEWFLPKDIDSFLISPNCQTCDIESELNSQYLHNSAYYMTPTASQCTQIPISRIGCDMDFNTYECRVCESSLLREDGYWNSYPIFNGLNANSKNVIHNFNEIAEMERYKYGLCLFTIRNANANHTDDSFTHCKTSTHEDLQSEIIIPRRKPSIGSHGKFCVCAKPKELKMMNSDLTSHAPGDNKQNKEEEIKKINKKFELFQSDFEDGTYRITQPGKYVIMEDIVFDFKAPTNYKQGNLDSYNEDGHWWPTIDQKSEYPGAGQDRDSYFLGFWAGITIECKGVYLDLNGHKLEMSKAFYYQQSFFALISLSSQVFLPGQGPGWFGDGKDMAAQNVTIRNGELGLTSHHGIQGNMNKDVLIENIKISHFKTHGIQLNGFENVKIKNVDIGPNMNVDKLSPYYSQLRHLLSTYKRMENKNSEIVNDLCLTFHGRDECVTMHDLINDVQSLLDMAFEYAVFDKDFDEENTDKRKLKLWNDHKNILINERLTPQTATLYGIFLNYVGSNVIGWYAGSDNTHSYNVTLENVHIHDLHHDTFENVGFSQGKDVGKQRIINCLAAPFNAYHIFGEDQVRKISHCNNYIEDNGDSDGGLAFHDEGLRYVGNKLVDIQIFAFKLINDYGLSWDYCSGGAADMNALVEFAFENTQFIEHTPLLIPSHDPMIHPGKGVIALRLNGVTNGELKNVKIENIHSSTDVGTLIGGKYENIVGQQAPYMKGYSMNMVNGVSMTFAKDIYMSGIDIINIVSDTGLSFGMSLWYDTQINIIDDIEINEVYAGKMLKKDGTFTEDSYPNLAPEACAIRIYDDEHYQVVINYEHDDSVHINCVHGHIGCLMDDLLYSHIGDVNNDDTCPFIDGGVGDGIIIVNELTVEKYLGNIMLMLMATIAAVIGIYYFCICTKQRLHDARFKYRQYTPLL